MKKKITFEPKLSIAKRISIKALDFEKLPKKFMSSNFKENTFFNITKSSSNLGIDNMQSSLRKQNKNTYYVKPLTSRSRNDNVIKLNDIPKTSYINVTPVQKMKQLSRNKNINNLFTQSIYQSYYKSNNINNINNNRSSAKCLTFNTNQLQSSNNKNTINTNNYNSNYFVQFNLLNKMSSNNGSSKNLINSNIIVNNSTYNFKRKNKENTNSTLNNNYINKFSNSNDNNINNFNSSNYNSHDLPNGHKNSAPKLLINGYKSNSNNSNGKNFRGTVNNFGSLSYKKFGIKVRKKKFLNKMGEEAFLEEKVQKMLNLEFFKNIDKLKIFILWRKYSNENSKKYKYYYLSEFLDKKIINYYYKNKLIKKYNQIKKEEKTWKKLVIPQNNLEINEQNKGSILIFLSEYANNTIQNIFFNNRIKNCNHIILYSTSLYIFELMINQLSIALSKIKYVFKYYYDEGKKAIIKRPSATEIKELLLNINRIIEKPNILNKAFQDFIINLSKYIANLNLNKIKAKPIVSQYLDFYRGLNNINCNNIQKFFQFGNIYNDFSNLQKKDTNYIIKEILNSLKVNENHLFKYYFVEDFNDNDNFFILLYKILPIKSTILETEEKFNNLINKGDNILKKDVDTVNDIQKHLDNLKENLDNIINEIQSKYNENLIDGKVQDINIILPYLMFQLIKNNIIEKNLFKGISLLETNKNYLSSKKNKDIYNTYNKLYNNGYLDFDNIIYLCLYDKYLKMLDKQISEDINKNTNLLYKILIYLEEMNNIHNKINVFEENKLSQKINLLHKNINNNKYNEKIEKLKKIVLNENNKSNKKNYFKKNNNFIELYQQAISHYIKYEMNNDKDNAEDKNQKISILEKILFVQLCNINNKKINNNLNFEKDILNKTGELKKIKELNVEDKNSKKMILPEKNKKKEVTYPYPRLLFLSEKDLSFISNSEKLSLKDISKYYNLIHPGQDLEIKTISTNKNIISGIYIFIENKKEKESDIFKLSNPIQISPIFKSNSNNNNVLYNLGTLYKNIKKEIDNSLTKQLMQSLNLFPQKEFHDWVNCTFNQITICTLCLIFTHEISKLLISDNKTGGKNSKEKIFIKDYKLINEKYNHFLTKECNSINNIKDRINTILTIISQMNIVDDLIKNDVHDINSFNWLKYIRHLWDKNKKSVIIECGGWANYQMKQLNKYRYKLLLSPDTDKIFLFNSSCFREKSASIIKVINNKYNNNSYKEIFEEYCSLFWTDMIYINLFITPNEDMKKIFDVCTTDCNWIYVENLDLFKYNNDNDCINNLIYFSKFIQTIQQEVILNDIKNNEGERMFCLMGCINVDDNIKNKCECLKGSSRILNFIKPDIDFYFNIYFKLHHYLNDTKNFDNNKNNNNKYLNDILLKKEQVIRDKLKGFYFDFDYFNEYLIYIIKTKCRNNLIKLDGKLEDIFINFIDKYSNKFLGINNKNYIEDNIIIKYFDNNKILVDNDRIQFFKYLFFITQNKMLKKDVLIKGYSRHFIINSFKKFYFEQTNQKLNEKDDIINGNIKIIYFKENNMKNDNINNENKKIVNLPTPKIKLLLKLFLENISQKLKKLNFTLNEKYQAKLIEYILKIIKNTSNNNNNIFYRIICNFNNWINKLIDMVEKNRKKINESILYNIVNECLIISLNHEKNIIKNIIETTKEFFELIIYKSLFDNLNNFYNKNDNKYFYFDIDKMAFRYYKNNLDYIKSYKQYTDNIITNSNIIFVFSEFYANKNGKELNTIFENDNTTRIFITDEIDKIYNSDKFNNYSQCLKIFSGYETTYNSLNINKAIINNNEKVSKILEKINNIFLNKYLYVLSKINIMNYSKDELMFIYHMIDMDYKENYNEKNINHPMDIIQDIYNIFPKSNYYININNKLLIYLFKNKILAGASSINFNIEKNNIYFTSNNIFINLSNDLCNMIIKEIISSLIKNNMKYKYLLKILKLPNNKDEDINYNYLEENEIILLSKMINDIYNIPSEFSFNEKYQNNPQSLSLFEKLFYLLGIQNKYLKKDNYYNCRIIIQFLKYGEIKEEKLNYKCLSTISEIFNNNASKINDISILINETLTNYKDLISNKKEYINSKYYFFRQIIISSNLKENIYNSILEKIYLSMSNHFLFSLLLTVEIMLNNFEISLIEKQYLLDYLKQNYTFPSNNTIKYKYETELETKKYGYIKENGKQLINFYTQKSKSVENNYLNILTKSLDNINNKYYFTSSLKKIERDIDKLLYYITFVPEQSSSMFKYIINKYLLKIINFSKFNINDTLSKKTTKENFIPITVNAFPSINVINFLCSLSAYYEINFYIVRNGNIYNNNIIDNINYGYQYLIDGELIELIKEGMKKGYWILICEKVDIIKFMKIIYELYNNLNEISLINKKFKIFFDEKLIEDNCQKAIENNTMIININYENVDDLEAAHDIWVNVLEEKILTDSVMNQTQKDVLDIIEDSSDDKTNLMGPSISNTGENKNINVNSIGNSLISVKSFYNNINNKNKFSNIKVQNNLAEITNWTFLKDV